MEWEKLAKSRLPEANFWYVAGSASLTRTNGANVDAFSRYRLKPKMLVNTTRRNTSIELFGKRYPSPLLIAPVGVQGIIHKDGEEATARAASDLKIPFIMSTAASRTIEQVAAAQGKGGDRWFQLYWPRPQDEAITVSMLNRARDSGYTALVVTVDTFSLGWRPSDLDTPYLPFIYGEGCQCGFSDPVFEKRYQERLAEEAQMPLRDRLGQTWEALSRPGSIWGALKLAWYSKTIKKSQAWLEVLNSATYREWDHLKILKEHWKGPILIKGLQTVEDAHKAIDFGMDGIIISNHGGRQVDGAIASLDALASIAADEKVKQSGLTLLFDSGVRSGSDILKALALGAKAVLIGRPYVYGLAIAGEDGVKHVLRCLLADMDNTLGLIGKTDIKDLSRQDLEVQTQGLAKL